MDTPYYEQLQYIGDTRIQALISYTVAGDDRLARQALRAFDDSRIPEGITRSRYPSSLPQSIPTFSLLYVGMLHDYWMYRPDPEFVRVRSSPARAPFSTGFSLRAARRPAAKLPWWSFIDWVQQGEIPTYDANGESCITTLEYLGALTDAADLEAALGDPVLATRYQARAAHVRTGHYAEVLVRFSAASSPTTPTRKSSASRPTSSASSTTSSPKTASRKSCKQMLAIEPGTTPNGVLSASYYFRFYLARALDHAGHGRRVSRLHRPLAQAAAAPLQHLAGDPGDTRSDSHAWSAHPIYDLLTLVAGIEPASPGFATVRIAPHLGSLPSLTATYPHPQGDIKVDYHWTGPHGSQSREAPHSMHIILPGTLTGTFQFDGRSWPLKPGRQQDRHP
jgi:alpha-L-rhamnosidase